MPGIAAIVGAEGLQVEREQKGTLQNKTRAGNRRASLTALG
jgi:hypothetical protein